MHSINTLLSNSPVLPAGATSCPTPTSEQGVTPRERQTENVANSVLSVQETAPTLPGLTEQKVSLSSPTITHFSTRVSKILRELGFSDTISLEELDKNFESVVSARLSAEASPEIVPGFFAALNDRNWCYPDKKISEEELPKMTANQMMADEPLLYAVLERTLLVKNFFRDRYQATKKFHLRCETVVKNAAPVYFFSAPVRAVLVEFGFPETVSLQQLAENISAIDPDTVPLGTDPDVLRECTQVTSEAWAEFQKNCSEIKPEQRSSDERVFLEALKGALRIRRFKIAKFLQQTVCIASEIISESPAIVTKNTSSSFYFSEDIRKILVEFGFPETASREDLIKNRHRLFPDAIPVIMTPELLVENRRAQVEAWAQFRMKYPEINPAKVSVGQCVTDEKLFLEVLKALVKIRRFKVTKFLQQTLALTSAVNSQGTARVSTNTVPVFHFSERIRKLLVEFGFPETASQEDLVKNFHQLLPEAIPVAMTRAIATAAEWVQREAWTEFRMNCPEVSLATLSLGQCLSDEKVLYELLGVLVKLRRFRIGAAMPKW
jgi:hypothetical protein